MSNLYNRIGKLILETDNRARIRGEQLREKDLLIANLESENRRLERDLERLKALNSKCQDENRELRTTVLNLEVMANEFEQWKVPKDLKQYTLEYQEKEENNENRGFQVEDENIYEGVANEQTVY